MVLGEGGSSSFSMKMGDAADQKVDNNDNDNNNNNFTVLVVDDDPLLRFLHDAYLKRIGIKDIQVVENGKMAVDLCLSGATFNLILMDKEMPVMDGAEATKQLRAMGVKSMIAGVTSREPYEQQDFIDAGLDYCFEKPLTPDIISFLLQELNKNN